MSLQKSENSNIFSLLDKEDEKQIMNLEQFGNPEKLVYQVGDNLQLSFVGIKHIGFLMAKTGNPLRTLEVLTELQGEKDEKTWYATVRIRNEKTHQEEIGVSQCPFYDGKGKLDPFARTKAVSKAERNAKKRLIPEYLITELIKEATSNGKVSKL